MTKTRAIRCVVAGRVQGVYYRTATAEQATLLALDGWVKNLSDGRVEVVVAGDATAVATLAGWLWQGPKSARVESVQLEEWERDVPRGFVVARER